MQDFEFSASLNQASQASLRTRVHSLLKTAVILVGVLGIAASGSAAERSTQLQSELTRAHREYYEASKSAPKAGDSRALYDKIVVPVEKKMHEALEQESRSVLQKNQQSEPRLQSSFQGTSPAVSRAVGPSKVRAGGDRDFGPRGQEGIGVDPKAVPQEVVFPGAAPKKPSHAR